MACDSGNEEKAKEALKKAVPTYREPDEVNNVVTMSKGCVAG